METKQRQCTQPACVDVCNVISIMMLRDRYRETLLHVDKENVGNVLLSTES